MTDESYLKKLADMQTQIKEPVPDSLKEDGERRAKILKEVIIRYQTEDGRTIKAYEQGELIRCKDCKYWDTDHLGYETMYCHRSDWNRLIRGAEDFCSRAERKEE